MGTLSPWPYAHQPPGPVKQDLRLGVGRRVNTRLLQLPGKNHEFSSCHWFPGMDGPLIIRCLVNYHCPLRTGCEWLLSLLLPQGPSCPGCPSSSWLCKTPYPNCLPLSSLLVQDPLSLKIGLFFSLRSSSCHACSGFLQPLQNGLLVWHSALFCIIFCSSSSTQQIISKTLAEDKTVS